MKPSYRVLEQNLEQLIRRAYRPVRPREAFVRQLEQALAPYIGEGPMAKAESRPILRPIFGALLAAAAALLILFGWSQYNPRPSFEPALATWESIVEDGAVAVRFGPGQAWRAASEAEEVHGVAPLGGFASVATPPGKSQLLAGAEGWTVRLGSAARLDVQPAETGLQFDLTRGTARFEGAGESRELSATERVLWFAGRFHRADGSPWRAAPTLPGETLLPSERVAEVALEEPEPTQVEQPTEDLDDPGGVIYGQVISSLEGVQIDGFEVSLLREVALPQVAQTRTIHFDGDEFEITGLDPGNYEVYVTAGGHAVWRRTEVPIRAGEFWEPDVLLDRGGTLRGFVVEKSTGAGLAGALVVSDVDMPAQVIGMGEEFFPEGARAFTYTKSDGSFEFPLLSLGQHNLRASHKDFAPSWVMGSVTSERGANMLFELSSGGGVSGRCEQPDGRPLSGAMVIVSRFGQSNSSRRMTYEQAWTNAEGVYSVEHLSPGAYVVLLFSSVDSTQIMQPKYQPIVVRDGAEEEANFLGEKRGASVRGTVFGPDGKPIPLANLHTMNLSAGDLAWKGDTASEAGEFEIVGLAEGEYHIFAGAGNASSLGANLALKPGVRVRRDIHLKGTDLRVRILDDQTGQPVDLVEVSLERRFESAASGATQNERMARVFHASQSAALLKYLATGRYDLIVLTESREYAIHVVPDLWIDENDPVQEVEVRLTQACRASLDVLDPDGQPIAGAKVLIQDQRAGRWSDLHSARTNATGAIAFGRLLEGPLRFEISHGLYRPQVLELTCRVGEPAHKTVVLSRD